MAIALMILMPFTPSGADTFPGKTSTWHGFKRHDFTVDGRKCILVTPEEPAKGKPWVWRARFFGHEPQADIALLKRGFHVAYCDVAGLFGNPKAVAHWEAFHKLLTEKHQFSKKPALEGMSRGGLIIYNWAAKNPDKVACLYGDAPVCDIRSWPGGKGTGKGTPRDWQKAMAAYGITEDNATEFKGSPIDNLSPLAKAKVPILHVVGDADKVVPVTENSDVVEKRYRELDGEIKVIRKKGVGHHPHALKDPKPIVDFIVKHASSP